MLAVCVLTLGHICSYVFMHVFVDDFAYVLVGACKHMCILAMFMPQCIVYTPLCVEAYVCVC